MTNRLKASLKERLSPRARFRLLRIYSGVMRLGNPLRVWRLRARNVGRDTYIARSVNVLGWAYTRIGENCVICEGTCINVNNRHGDEPRIVIGHNAFIGRRNFFSNARQIVLKDYCMTAVDCHFSGGDHDFADPFTPHISTGVNDDTSIVLGVNVRLGTDVTVLGNVTIGHGSVVGAGALVSKSIPPFSLAIGSPARVVKRFDMTRRQWIAAADFTPEMEALIPDEDSYLATIKANKPYLYMAYDAAGKCRGDLP